MAERASQAADEMVDGRGQLRPHWRELMGSFSMLGEGALVERGRRLDRGFADDGVTSMMPGEAPLRWRCDPVPLLIPPAEFAAVEAGLVQRAQLLSYVLDDIHGAQDLLASGALPPAMVFADPHYLRLGAASLQGPKLHLYAADLIRASDGQWRVKADRTGRAGGIAYAQENRRQLARVLPEALRSTGVRPLEPFFDQWQDALRPLAPNGVGNPTVALLTRGTQHRHWFEHMHLARLLSCALVEGGDLTVRNGALFLKTLRGLQRIDLLLRQIDGRLIDPLELDGNSVIGVPGLLDAARAGNVRIVNHPGSAVLEAKGLAALLPALCQRLLGSALLMGNAAPEDVPSLAPCLTDGRLDARPVVWRVFLMFDGTTWRVLPVGLARIRDDEAEDAPLPGLAKDVWVMHDEQSDIIGPLAVPAPRLALRRTSGELPSRVADNLFWLGRYVERLDSGARLGRAALTRLGRASRPREFEELQTLGRILADARLIDAEAVASSSLAIGLHATMHPGGAIGGLFTNIAGMTEKVRDRLTGDMYASFTQTLRAAQEAAKSPTTEGLGSGLLAISRFCTAVAGLASENMVRGGGFMFLDLGRRIERARAVVREVGFVLDLPAQRIDSGLMLALELCDSAITYRSRYLNVLQPAPVLDLVLADQGNPRGLAFQLVAMRDLLEDLGSEAGVRELLAGSAAGLLAEVEMVVNQVLNAPDQAREAAQLPRRLRAMGSELDGLSNRITRRYFAVLPASQTVGLGRSQIQGAA